MTKTEKELDPTETRFNELNEEFGGALRILPKNKYKLIGRFEHLKNMSIVLERPDTPVGILLAPAGVGKTASMQAWKESRETESGNKVIILTLDIGMLASEGTQLLQKRLERLVPRIKKYEKDIMKIQPKIEVVLFIDEIHMVVSIFGSGSKVGGDLLKRSLSEDVLRIMTATTENEYNSYIASDAALERRFKPIRMKELKGSEVVEVLKSRLAAYGGNQLAEGVSEEVLNKIVTVNKLYRAHLSEPAKSIDVLETMVAYHKVEGNDFDLSLVDTVFKLQYNISLDIDADVNHIQEVLNRRVKGQPFAVFNVMRMIKAWIIRLEENTKPLSAILSGPTGVGKTELVKSVSEGLFNSEDNIFFMNMTDYQSQDTDEVFRRVLGQWVSHHPSTIILLDELEKADKNVINTLLSILDEGIVTYMEKGTDGYSMRKKVSLRNCLVFGTTNAGADMHDIINKFSDANLKTTQENVNVLTSDQKMKSKQVSLEINEALLSEGFPPEILGRFSYIIGFQGLAEATLITIAHNKLVKMLNKFSEMYDLSFKLPKKQDWTATGFPYKANPLAMYIVFERAQQKDTKSGGARNIERIIESDIKSQIIDAIFDYPGHKSFILKTNEKSIFEDKSSVKGEGDIIVIPEELYNRGEASL